MLVCVYDSVCDSCVLVCVYDSVCVCVSVCVDFVCSVCLCLFVCVSVC